MNYKDIKDDENMLQEPVFNVTYKGNLIECYTTLSGDYNYILLNGVEFGRSDYGDITIDYLNDAFKKVDEKENKNI